MKKVLSLVLTLIMTFTLAACSNNADDGNNTNGGGTVKNSSSDKQVIATQALEILLYMLLGETWRYFIMILVTQMDLSY